MKKSFELEGKQYFPKTDLGSTGIQWGCRHEDGLEKWALVPFRNPTKTQIIDAINDVDDVDRETV